MRSCIIFNPRGGRARALALIGREDEDVVKRFAELLDRLAYTPSRNDKLRLLADYFAATPDPDRGWALAALTDGLFFRLPLPPHPRRDRSRRASIRCCSGCPATMSATPPRLSR